MDKHAYESLTSDAAATDEAAPAAPIAAAPPAKQRRGFAVMDPEKRRVIASAGGKASHVKGRAHEWSSAEARVAGLKGAIVSREVRSKQRRAAP